MNNNSIAIIIFLSVIISSCKKNNSTTTGQPLPCQLIRYDNKHISNAHYYTYEYGANNSLNKMSKILTNTVNPQFVKFIDHTSKAVYGHKSIAGKIHVSTVYEYNGVSRDPIKATLTTEDFTTGVNISRISGYFFFSYDSKGRLIKVEQTTPVVGDWEYNLDIFYNNQDNVIQIESEFTTGPRTPKSIVSVKAYDNKQNPYSSIPQWKFISDAGWSFHDPEAVLTALSKNNPLDYTMGTFVRKMEYSYNENGYPIKRLNTNTNLSGTFKFEETFTYQCN